MQADLKVGLYTPLAPFRHSPDIFVLADRHTFGDYPLVYRETARAKRFILSVPITYRADGNETWLSGRIVNVSESGILFAPAVVEPGQAIEVIFTTPVPIESIAPGRLICGGKVVRTAAAGTAAAHFDEVRFLLES